MSIDTDSFLAAAEHLTGFLIVMLTLGLLWGLTELLGRIFARQELSAAKQRPAPVAASPVASSGSEMLPDDIAVVAAAVAYLLDEPHQIVSVRPQPSSWGQQGRRDIHASHRIR